MPDLATAAAAAHRTMVESSTPDIARFLQEVLGQKLVAYVVGVSDPKAVGRWATAQREPREASERRLREAYQVCQLLLGGDGAHTIRAWFMGLNPQLDDESPASALRDGRARDVLVAAKTHLAGG